MRKVLAVAVLVLLIATFASAGVKEADSLYGQGKYNEALTEYRASLDGLEGIEKARAQYQIGICLYLTKDYKNAITEFEKVASIPNAGEWVGLAYQYAGYCYRSLGDNTSAIAEFQKCIADKNTKPEIVGGAYFTIGAILSDSGQYDSGLEELKKAIPLVKGNVLSLANYYAGFCLNRLGRENEAQDYFIAGCQVEGASVQSIKINFNNISKTRLGIDKYKALVKNMLFIIPATAENVDFLSQLKSELKKLED